MGARPVCAVANRPAGVCRRVRIRVEGALWGQTTQTRQSTRVTIGIVNSRPMTTRA